MSRQDKEVETEAARQSHYIFWCSIIGIPDLYGNEIGYQRIITIYAKLVMCGVNYYNKDVLQSSTLCGYATAVNTLFQLRGFKQPTNLSNPSNMAGIIINNLINEETVASQRSPLDSTIFAELQRAASSSHSCDSDQNLLFDILTLARFIGPCISEYAQTTQDKVDYHVYPSGTRVIKAFAANDFVFCNKNGHILTKIDDHHSSLPLLYRLPGASRRTIKTARRSNSLQIEPLDMPHPGSTANGHESPPSCTTGRHAGCLLQNQESPIAIHHRQQGCYAPLQGSKESTNIYFS